MAAIPLLIAAASLGYSLVLPDTGVSRTRESRTSLQSWSTLSSTSVFGLGVAFGMAASSFLNHELKRQRLWEKLRLTFQILISDFTNNTEGGQPSPLTKYRSPTLVDKIEKTMLQSSEDDSGDNQRGGSFRQDLVSPDWSFASDLQVCLLTLVPQAALVPQPAPGVECYYVLQGKGTFTKDKEEPLALAPGFCVLVDPQCIRSFQNTDSSGDPLVLLRATDVASEADMTKEMIPPASSKPSTALVQAGLRKVEAMIQHYSTNDSNSNPEVSLV